LQHVPRNNQGGQDATQQQPPWTPGSNTGSSPESNPAVAFTILPITEYWNAHFRANCRVEDMARQLFHTDEEDIRLKTTRASIDKDHSTSVDQCKEPDMSSCSNEESATANLAKAATIDTPLPHRQHPAGSAEALNKKNTTYLHNTNLQHSRRGQLSSNNNTKTRTLDRSLPKRKHPAGADNNNTNHHSNIHMVRDSKEPKDYNDSTTPHSTTPSKDYNSTTNTP